MAKTKMKGDLGQAMVTVDVLKRGYRVALPMGEDWDYDLIVLQKGKLERVQCKYTEANDGKIIVRCRSCNNWSIKKYTNKSIDWIACYDKTTEKCYYVPSELLGSGRRQLNLRIEPSKNKQKKFVVLAKDFLEF